MGWPGLQLPRLWEGPLGGGWEETSRGGPGVWAVPPQKPLENPEIGQARGMDPEIGQACGMDTEVFPLSPQWERETPAHSRVGNQEKEPSPSQAPETREQPPWSWKLLFHWLLVGPGSRALREQGASSLLRALLWVWRAGRVPVSGHLLPRIPQAVWAAGASIPALSVGLTVPHLGSLGRWGHRRAVPLSDLRTRSWDRRPGRGRKSLG